MTALAAYVVSLLTMGGGYRETAYSGLLALWLTFANHRRAGWYLIGIARVGLTVLAVAQVLRYGYHSDQGLLNPNIIASALLACWPAGPITGGVWLIGLVATGSRTAWAAGAIALAVMYAPRRWALAIVGAIGLAVVAVVAVRPATVASRMTTYSQAVDLFLRRPVAGWGVSSFSRISTVEGGNKTHADSMPLTVAAEQGVIGLTLAGWLFAAIYREHYTRADHQTRAALAAVALSQLTDYTLTWPIVAGLVGVRLAMIDNHV